MNRLASNQRLGVFALLAGLSATASATPSLESVRVEIRAYSATEFEVRTQFQLDAPFDGGQHLSHLALLDSDQRIELLVTTADGAPVEAVAGREPRALRLLVTLSDARPEQYEISYRVTSPRTGRVPILVPELATTRPQAVVVSLTVPNGYVLAESFPRFEEKGDAWVAVLSNVPSFVLIRIHAGEARSFSDRFLTAESLTNLLIPGVLAAFTAYWLVSRRTRAS
ncbi:MAG: hypothetical protein L0Y58_08510 [Verrucomicrobia subdivision 3 bacterium]|nr:hypothetical protein [Limisphaerales bacterium]